MMMTETCSCSAQTHAHHEGRSCDRPAISPAEEIEQDAPDQELGAVCLECYQLLAVELHEADPDSVVDLNVSPSFLMCEAPSLG
ncbi:MAG: hypothetical protein AB7P33_10570 [Dehalococcoidia bacterium]